MHVWIVMMDHRDLEGYCHGVYTTEAEAKAVLAEMERVEDAKPWSKRWSDGYVPRIHDGVLRAQGPAPRTVYGEGTDMETHVFG